MQDLQTRIDAAETRIFKMVFSNTTNNYGTLFGGNAMQLMDEVAFIAATRFSRKKMVTVSSSQIDFKKPIPENTIIELIARIVRVGNTSLDIHVDIYKEEMYENRREQAIEGRFTFVALDENKKPTKVL